jgi:predicted nuclease of restriction endonuclease-like RecB superfamily
VGPVLTADLVRATCRAGQLHITPLAGKQRTRAEELAAVFLSIAQAHTGSAQHELKEAFAAVDIAAREAKLAAGLIKLIEDACEFEAESPVPPRELRSELFTLAAAARRALSHDQRFDRAAVLQRAAAPHGLSAEQLQLAIYSDLKSEHRLLRAPELAATQLLDRYDLAQYQAVLLRAVKITAHIYCPSAAGYRDIFRKLKFRRLLFQISPEPSGTYRIDIDGPYSLFDSVTKYGLSLALMLPSLLAADRISIQADLRWGKARTPVKFSLERHATARDRDATPQPAHLPEEVTALLDTFRNARDGWTVQPADTVLDLPGVGLCVPDLRFTHASGTHVFLEVLGYWSRDAVWQRVELVNKGLAAKVLFAASERLRVSEQVLADHPSGALYVYKSSLSAKAVVEHLERLRRA